MSTFGKKYLNYWPYEFEDPDGIGTTLKVTMPRWNNTPIDFQLEILKKWYPIGMKGKCILVGSNKPSVTIVEIVGYLEFIWGYTLDVDYVDSDYRKEMHPIRFIPLQEDRFRILRELKLNNLLD